MHTAIILAGGTGQRAKTKIPKQYIRIGDYMLITYTLRAILRSSRIEAVWIVAEKDWREAILADAEKAGLNISKIKGFAAPGTNRQTSILHGMQSILRMEGGMVDISNAEEQDTVFIHDAARPFLKEETIEACFEALEGHDGVMPVLPMKDTVYLSVDGKSITDRLERSQLFAGQAPELFLLRKYYEANLALLPDKILQINGSSEPAVMAGMRIAMIPGDESNFKVTTETDVIRCMEIIERRNGGVSDESLGTAWNQ